MEQEAQSAIYGLRGTANREDQVMDFIVANAQRKKLEVFAVVRPHGMRGYIFLEAGNRTDAEHEVNIQKNDIVEIISGPFKREQAKITRIDKQKEEVVVELLEAAVPIPITVRLDAVKVIRRETEEEEKE